MRNIESISIWKDGELKTGIGLDVLIYKDNLQDYAIFGYQISAESTEIIANGELHISGQDYEDWTDNDYAWNYVATKLGLTFI